MAEMAAGYSAHTISNLNISFPLKLSNAVLCSSVEFALNGDYNYFWNTLEGFFLQKPNVLFVIQKWLLKVEQFSGVNVTKLARAETQQQQQQQTINYSFLQNTSQETFTNENCFSLVSTRSFSAWNIPFLTFLLEWNLPMRTDFSEHKH